MEAKEKKDILKKILTSAQIVEGQARAKEIWAEIEAIEQSKQTTKSDYQEKSFLLESIGSSWIKNTLAVAVISFWIWMFSKFKRKKRSGSESSES